MEPPKNEEEVKSKAKILIVDDQVFNVNALMMILLHSMKIDIETVCDSANNGKKALGAVEGNIKYNKDLKGVHLCDYNLILMDCNMPFMDGYEAT